MEAPEQSDLPLRDGEPIGTWQFSYAPLDHRWGAPVAAAEGFGVVYWLSSPDAGWQNVVSFPEGTQLVHTPSWSPDNHKLLFILRQSSTEGKLGGTVAQVMERVDTSGLWRVLGVLELSEELRKSSYISSAVWGQDSATITILYTGRVRRKQWFHRYQLNGTTSDSEEVPRQIGMFTILTPENRYAYYDLQETTFWTCIVGNCAGTEEALFEGRTFERVSGLTSLPNSSYIAFVTRSFPSLRTLFGYEVTIVVGNVRQNRLNAIAHVDIPLNYQARDTVLAFTHAEPERALDAN